VVYMPSDTGFELPRSAFVPLRTVSLLGREVPAPADSEGLLEATYGPRWRVPDPSFKYVTPRWLSRRIGGWFGGLKTHRNHWDAFYAGRPYKKVPNKPTPFAHWVAEHYPSDRPLLDLGAGNARDARFFAQRVGRPVTAVDYSGGVLTRVARRVRAKQPGLDLQFQALNLYDTREVMALGTRLARQDSPVDLYARFTLHALDYYGRENVLRLANLSLRRGGYLFLEFRTAKDRARPHAFGEYGRRYLRPAVVVAQIENAGGVVVHRSEGTGLARFKHEDPHVCRIVARWGSPETEA
jgi:SAM-dependent methyltransferase